MSQVEAMPTGYWRRRVDWLVGLVAGCSLLTLFARQWWVADLIANLRVQLILGLLASLVLLSIMRRWQLMLVVLAVTLGQATALHSAFQTAYRTSDQSSSSGNSATVAEKERGLRVFLANVLTRNQHHDQIIAQIRTADPDVIAILEIGSALEESMQREFGTTHKYFVSEPQDDGNFGIGLWSRYPLANSRIFHLNVPILPSIEADIVLRSSTIHIIATHPLPPMGARNFSHRNRHLALLAQRVEKQRQVEPPHPVILLGDLNLTPWSPLFDDFLALTNLHSAAAGRGLEPTWYRWSAFPFGLILDHGLHSDELSCDRRTILPANGSDHRALVFSFSLIGPS